MRCPTSPLLLAALAAAASWSPPTLRAAIVCLDDPSNASPPRMHASQQRSSGLPSPELAVALRGADSDAKGSLSAKEATLHINPEPAPDSRWRITLSYFQGGEKGTNGTVNGDFSLVNQNGVALTLGYVLAPDLADLPLDLILQGSLLWHNEQGWQPDFLQYTAAIKLEWKGFPWNDYLDTRFGLASGFSYVGRIPYAEYVNREGEPSRNLLNYLELSLSVNAGDVFRLVQLDHLFRRYDSSHLDAFWIVGSIFHRSGAWGLYGENKYGDPVSDGSDFYAIGIQADF